MKFSIATAFVAATLLASCDAKKKRRKTKKRELVGDCSILSFETFTVETGYKLTDNIVYTYPCSGGYLRNFAANDNLLTDVRDAINKKGRDMGIKADCANLCDIDNGSYDTTSSTGTMDLDEVLDQPKIFCDIEHGILNDPDLVRNDDFGIGPNGENACDCLPDSRPDYTAGCGYCTGTVEFSVKTCVDSRNAGKKKRSKKDSNDDEPPAEEPAPAPTPVNNRPPSSVDDD